MNTSVMAVYNTPTVDVSVAYLLVQVNLRDSTTEDNVW